MVGSPSPIDGAEICTHAKAKKKGKVEVTKATSSIVCPLLPLIGNNMRRRVKAPLLLLLQVGPMPCGARIAGKELSGGCGYRVEG